MMTECKEHRESMHQNEETLRWTTSAKSGEKRKKGASVRGKKVSPLIRIKGEEGDGNSESSHILMHSVFD